MNGRTSKQLAVQHVTLRPLQLPDVSKVSTWLKVPAVRESFVPQFPQKQSELRNYFADPTREYFGSYYDDQLVGIVGGENIDLRAGKLEMKKLVGESGLTGQRHRETRDVRLPLLCFYDSKPEQGLYPLARHQYPRSISTAGSVLSWKGFS